MPAPNANLAISPALRRAFMRVNPDYFSLPIDQQEHYRVRMPAKDAFRLRQSLLSSLFDINVRTDAELEAATEAFNDEQHLVFNRALLPATGIGENYFWLNEYMADGQTILDFNTLYDFDHDDHAFQEKARAEEFPGYAARPYRGTLHHTWARLMIDGKFHYASLSMAASHVYSVIEDFGDAQLSALIPHRYVDGKDHGKREGKGTIFSQRLEANGLEQQAEELRRRLWNYMAGRYEALLTEFDARAERAVYMEDRSLPHEAHMNFILSDKTALQGVRLRHFMNDCRPMLADRAELDAVIARERQTLSEQMESAYRDILANFDPKVVTLRKKRKIIVADGALGGLF